MSDKSRNWLFTCNKYDESDVLKLKELAKQATCRYMVFGFEKAPTTGHEHLQGFVIFYNARKFDGVKRWFSELQHADLRRGNEASHSMAEYCKKEGDFWEWGVAPIPAEISGARGASQRKVNFLRIVKLAEEGNWAKLKRKYTKQFVGHYRTIRAIHKDFGKRPPDIENVCGIWIYGASGTGKSHYARVHFGDHYDKACNKWWDNYDGEANVLIDDFDIKHEMLAHFLKRWADKYSFSGEIKGGQINLRPEKIVVTSQYRINEIWSDKETQDALNRRFIKIKISIDSQGNRVIQNQGF